MQRLRLGIVGLGNMGKNHLRIAGALANVQLVGGYDVDLKNGSTACRKYHTKFYANLEQLMNDVEALVISAPTLLHYSLAQQALLAGKHVLVEKPLSATKVQAQKLVQLARSKGLVLQVGHIERFNPVYAELRNILSTEKLLAVEGFRMSPYAKQAADVSVTFDLLIHDLDLLLGLLVKDDKDFKNIQHLASGMAFGSDQMNYVSCQLKFGDGTLAHLTASKITHEKIRQFYLTCQESFIVADFLLKTINIYRHHKSDYTYQQSSTKYQQSSVVERVFVPNQEPLQAEVVSFAEAVLQNRPPVVDGTDGVRAIDLAERIDKQALKGLIIKSAHV